MLVVNIICAMMGEDVRWGISLFAMMPLYGWVSWFYDKSIYG